jgi:hypothetical protein
VNIKIKSKIIIAASIAVMSSCAKNNTESDNSLSRQDEVPSEIASLIPAKDFLESLKTHCAACHNIGEYRFFHDDMSPEENLKWLKTEKSKLTDRSWAVSIIEVLSWPVDGRVPLNTDRVDADRRFMPFGRAKHEFNDAEYKGRAIREVIIDALD